MGLVGIQETLKQAVVLHQQGQLGEAQALYRQVLQAIPDQPDANHLLGVIAYQTGHLDAAVELIGRAISASPQFAAAWVNLGNVLADQGKQNSAIDAYQRALAIQPDAAATHNNLGTALKASERLAEARMSFERAVALKPDYVEALVNLATVQRLEGRLTDALLGIELTRQLQPNDWTLCLTQGNLLKDLGRFEEAAACLKRALELHPHSAESLSNLGNVLTELSRWEEAERCFSEALALKPDLAEIHMNGGNLLRQMGRTSEAEEHYLNAIALSPDLSEAHASYASLLKDLARHEEAAASFQRALILKPDYAEGMSSYLFSINYLPDADPAALFDAYREFGRRFEAPLAPEVRPHVNDRNPNRRLRIGYVSPDFRGHACALFIEPLFEAHDREQVEIWCYAEDRKADEVTDRIRHRADRWISTVGMSHQDLADRIRDDGIDVLVDLAGHSGNNRLLAFARKPAPIQVSWLGMGYTTGLSNMDYFLTDRYFVPPEAEPFFTETVYRLPRAAYAYRPPLDAPSVRPLPALARGHVTFGCFSRTVRLNHRVVAVWADILRQVPQSRLVLNAGTLKDHQIQAMFRKRFVDLGVSGDRIEFAITAGTAQTMAAYGEIDIALDPFPHNAGTTTFEALWMGVPVVSLKDRPPLGRFGESILSRLGLTGWLAETPDDYVKIAVQAAGQREGLAELRGNLRERMAASAFRDERGFAQDVEAAYRDMWQRWCATGKRSKRLGPVETP